MIYLLHQALERAAGCHPEQLAFEGASGGLTFAQVEDRSNALARVLVDQGVNPGDRVGVFLPRSLDSAVAVYGVLKAGAAYVPVDPQTPPTRLQSLVSDCGLRCLMVDKPRSRMVQANPPSGLEFVIGVEAPDGPVRSLSWDVLDAFSGQGPPGLKLTEDDLAYIMYTSGSTGQPKGIMHTHRSGLAYARLSAHTYAVGPQDKLGNHSPLHFDMSTMGYLTAPFAGATCVLVPEAHARMPASLSQFIQDTGITIWYSVPFVLIQLLLRGALESRDLKRLRWVLYGGEPFPVKHLRALMQQLPATRFANVYGPAEVNQCTYFHFDLEQCSELEDVPLGRIWDNTQGLVLDAEDQEAAQGELLVRSPTMMQGYWNRPDLNARAFYRVTDTGGHQRVYYRTGDLVSVDSEGRLHFLGRKDRQVKIRGHRVELDEVESILSNHPEVEEAAVFPIRREAEDQTVVGAAAILNSQASVESRDLLRYLSERVPRYALPALLELHLSFPRTGTGKIDRRALQAAAEAVKIESR